MTSDSENKLIKRVTIPECVIFSGKLGGNSVTRLANQSITTAVEITDSDISCFYLLRTKLSVPFDEIYLKKPRMHLEDHKGKYCLKIKHGGSVEDLNKSTKLEWINNPIKDCDLSPDKIAETWVGKFSFKEDIPGIQEGLRKPQLGALHSISAYFATDQERDPATIVLPTGTGKTETMLSTLIYQNCAKVLVIVPSKILRDQITNKFATLGKLQALGVVGFDIKMPYVATVTKGIKSAKIARDLIAQSNVIIATIPIINSSTSEFINLLSENCTHLFFDEAHHIAATTWKEIKDKFIKKKIIQFTATPFRKDGKPLGGKIIYNYTMGEAQRAGYFMPINMQSVDEYYEDDADREIAQAAVKKLRGDMDNQLEHLLLARVKSKARAENVFEIYRNIAPELSPIVVYSGLAKHTMEERLAKLHRFESKIVVCVDMLGEGYDLPNLKIAAIHDHHKSLAITLQFIGRFTRTNQNQNIGKATAVVNIADPELEKELNQLYSQGADWDVILSRLSEQRIQEVVDIQEIIDSLKTDGDLHKVISLWNMKPSLSARLFTTQCTNWTPCNFKKDIPNFDNYWYAMSEEEKLLIILAINSTPVKWGTYKELNDINHKLLIAYWNQEHNTLSVFSNDYDAFRVDRLAKNICGDRTNTLSGERIFNIFNNIEFPLVRNLGGSQVGAISFTQFFGPNVTDGLGRIAQSELNLSNIATIGYESGEKVIWGCSERKGKIWSPRACKSILGWRNWVNDAWQKIFQGGIDRQNITRDFLKPVKITTRYEQFPISVQWGDYLLYSYDDQVKIKFGNTETLFYLVNLSLVSPSEDGPLQIKISTEDISSTYELRIINQSPNFEYELIHGTPISITKGRGVEKDFIEYMNTDPIHIHYVDGSFSYNCFLVKVSDAIGLYSSQDLDEVDWNGVNIRRESMGINMDQDTVQYRTYTRIANEYDVVINDDGSGEVADLIALKSNEDEIVMELIHCKYSSQPNPGARVHDLYEVCGQAQRSTRWKHTEFFKLYSRIKHRNKTWVEAGSSRFVKGDIQKLTALKDEATRKKLKLKVTIVQPGVSARQVTPEMLRLLGSTAYYIKKTTEADLKVVVSS